VVSAPTPDIFDIASAAFERDVRNFGSAAEGLGIARETTDTLNKYRGLSGGGSLAMDAINTMADDETARRLLFDNTEPNERYRQGDKEINKLVDDFILQRRRQSPDGMYNDILTRAEQDANVTLKAKEAMQRSAEIEGAATGFQSFVGQAIGGVGAGFYDPINLASIPIGGAITGTLLKGFVGSSLARIALVEAGIGAVTETAIQPFIANWQKELGNEYGIGQALTNVAAAGLFSSAFAVAPRVVTRSVRASKSAALSRAVDIFRATGDARRADAAAMEVARLYMVENMPQDMSVNTHNAVFLEMHAAILERRLPDFSKIPDFDIDKFAKETIDNMPAAAKETWHRYIDDAPVSKTIDPDIPANAKAQESTPFSGEKIDPDPDLANANRLLDEYESDDVINAEQIDYETTVRDMDDDAVVLDTQSDGSVRITKKQLTEELQADKDFLDALSVCTRKGGS
jgi:hypothetical protein